MIIRFIMFYSTRNGTCEVLDFGCILHDFKKDVYPRRDLDLYYKLHQDVSNGLSMDYQAIEGVELKRF